MDADDAPWILGISASHNGAVCLLKGDEIVVAVQEERLSGFKRHRICGADAALAIGYCLSYAGIEARDLSLVVLCVQGRTRDKWHDIRANPALNVISNQVRTLVIPHHYGHAFSAFATSGFDEAAVLVVDGAGSPAEDFTPEERAVVTQTVEDGWETISLYTASGTSVVPLEKHVVERGGWLNVYKRGMPGFGSLGGMFSAASQQIFGNATEAGKVMGLAPYGEPSILAEDFFDISEGCFHFKETVPRKFACADERWPARESDYQNLAASVQSALERALLYLVGRLRELCPSDNLCYAGGVALNSVANERIVRESGFANVYIMPAAEDSGPAVGAAYYGLWQLTRHNSRRRMAHDACGRVYSSASVSSAVEKARGVRVLKSEDVISDAADLLCEGKIIGWFDGRAELGPRALGQRSIVCDPRRPDAKEVLNSRVKFREAFRPFAPVALVEEVEEWFELDGTPHESPFMLRVCKFKEGRADEVPAVVHVDGTGRLQTVARATNGRFYELVRKFYEKTGIPIILNTSFNVMGQPIVETPADAISCLLRTGLDCCVFEDGIVFKDGANEL
ncbi:MAG TPA: carbamoyltransferase C-terminal domain-containing protein [Pyrinomonadaceae bacterium]|jgi:carbamoyltransferase|nr:carbamoyltransferase C-terminal domain-containing protein [Pyrinomonadaceae bacterium]